MMDFLKDAGDVVLAACAPFLLLILRQITVQAVDHFLRNGIAGGASRIAGEAILTPEVRALGEQAVNAAVSAGAVKLAERYPGTVKRFGMTPETLRGMVLGEIGKLTAPAAAIPDKG